MWTSLYIKKKPNFIIFSSGGIRVMWRQIVGVFRFESVQNSKVPVHLFQIDLYLFFLVDDCDIWPFKCRLRTTASLSIGRFTEFIYSWLSPANRDQAFKTSIIAI